MASYQTPGVYIEEINAFPDAVIEVPTSVTAFIGYTQKAKFKRRSLRLKPFRITSLKDYETYFGTADSEKTVVVTINDTEVNNTMQRQLVVSNTKPSPFLMYYALELYFANGGGPCYIVSVGLYGSARRYPATTVKKNNLSKGLEQIQKEPEPKLLVFPDATNLESTEDFYVLFNEALQQCHELKNRFTIVDTKSDGPISGNTIQDLRDKLTNNNNHLKYGAAYYPFLETNLAYQYLESNVVLKHYIQTGNSSSTLGNLHDRVLSDLKAVDANLYATIGQKMSTIHVVLPPSSTIAGIYARTDHERGVWKAPANISLNNVIRPTVSISNEDQAILNVDISGKSVNAIREFTGKGVRVWGARTLAGNDNEWKYVPVRRLFNMIEESVKKAIMAFVFEPNDQNTWTTIRAMIENYMILKWREGALMGIKPEEAFFVRVGLGQTMTAEDILNGRMTVEIGIAPVRPAEFIILRFSQKMANP